MFPSSDDSTKQLIFGTDLLSGRSSSVVIATRYCLDGPGFESHWRRDFPCRPDGPWGPTGLPHSNKEVSFPGVKRPGLGVNHPPTSSAEVKERAVIPLLSLWTFMACCRGKFILTYLRNYTASFPRWQYLNTNCWDNRRFHTANSSILGALPYSGLANL